jgi:hypothetical protein
MFRVVLFLLVVLLVSARADDFTRFLEQEEFDAHFMKENPSERITALVGRMQKSMQEHKSWFMEYVKNMTPKDGGPLPYHPNFGLTQEEYAEFLADAKTMTLKEVLVFHVKVLHLANGEVKFDTGKKMPPMEEFSFYPKDEKVVTVEGALSKPQLVDQSGSGGAIGPWTGVQFRLQDGERVLETGSATSVTFTFGKRLSDNMPFFIYRAQVMRDFKTSKAQEIVCFTK